MAVQQGYEACYYIMTPQREGWRIRNNDELEKLMRREDIVKYIRAQRIKWWEHLNRRGKKTVRKITEWNPEI
jgi:hypothetical protein